MSVRRSSQISGSQISESEKEKPYLGEYHGRRTSEGLRQGYAWCILPNSDVYIGNYENGMRNGIGMYVFQNGSRYNGQWRNNCKHGEGKMSYPDGSYYEGQWRHSIPHGHGRYYYINGDTYVGNWKDGKRHGLGTYTFAKLNVIIKCIWNYGVQSGSGKIRYPLFTFYGTWDEGIMEGKGLYSFHNKCFQEGVNIVEKQESLITVTGTEKESGTQASSQNVEAEEEGIEEMEESGDYSKILTSNETTIEKKPLPTEWVPLSILPFDVNLLPPEPLCESTESLTLSEDVFPCSIKPKKPSSIIEESLEEESEENDE